MSNLSTGLVHNISYSYDLIILKLSFNTSVHLTKLMSLPLVPGNSKTEISEFPVLKI